MTPGERQAARPRSALVTVIDLLAILGCAVACYVVWSGGNRFRVGPLRISARDPLRIILSTGVLAAARWLVWPRMPMLAGLRFRFDWQAIAAATQRFSWAAVSRWIRQNASQMVRDGAGSFVRLAAACALVVAQPILDTVARSPEFLVAHGATRLDIVVMVGGILLLVPLLLSIPVALLRLAGRAVYEVVESVLFGALMAAFTMQFARHAGIQTAAVAIPLALGAGLVVAIAYLRTTVTRTIAMAASFSVLVVPGLFFAKPAVRRLMAPPPDPGLQQVQVADVALNSRAAVPVMLLVFDETPLISLLDPDGKIDPDLYPSFAALARDGILFRNATTVSDYTQWAVPAIVSGRYPRPAASPTAAEYPQTLYTLLGRSYRFVVREPITSLCPPSICVPEGTPWSVRLGVLASDLRYAYLHAISTPDLARRLPSLTDDWRDFGVLGERRRRDIEEVQHRRPGEINVRLAEDFLDRIRPVDGQPVFFVLHTLMQHFPHLQLPSGQLNSTRADVPAFASGEQWNSDDWATLQLYQRHLLQLEFVDRFLGRFTDRLRAMDLYGRTLIIVTADHGISFEPGTWRRNFTMGAAADIMRVPLIVKPPEGARTLPSTNIGGQHISDRNAQTIDILPTIADILGVQLPWPVDGVSLFDSTRPEPETKVIFYDQARQSRKFDRTGPDMAAALKRKLAAFDVSGNDHLAPQPDRFRGLIGRTINELRLLSGGGTVAVDYLRRFLEFHVGRDETPFDVAGRFEPVRRDRRTYVAVAVNGIVRAVTHTWDSNPSAWQATPPLSTWQEGHNEVQVFVVEGDEQDPVLRRCDVRAGAS